MLKLKSGRTFIDNSNVEQDTGFIVRYESPSISLTGMTLKLALWKDQSTWKSAVANTAKVFPIMTLPDIFIGGLDFITYFLTPVTPSVVPISPLVFLSEQLYKYLAEVKPIVPLINWDDWEVYKISGVPATLIR